MGGPSRLVHGLYGGDDEAGIIEDCSFARMAGHVDRIFDTGNTENTVLNKLKEQLPEADSIVDGMKAEFKNFKSRNKK